MKTFLLQMKLHSNGSNEGPKSDNVNGNTLVSEDNDDSDKSDSDSSTDLPLTDERMKFLQKVLVFDFSL